MWLNGLFSFIGGGELVFYVLLQALIAESIPQSSLSAFYLYSSAAALILKVVGSSTSLSMMESSIWLPLFLSVGIKVVSIPIILLFLKGGVGRAGRITDFHLVPIDETRATTFDSEEEACTKAISIWGQAIELRRAIRNRLFPLGICALQEVGNSFRIILPYWLSMRYHWTLRETGYVTIGEMLITGLIISLLPHLAERLHDSKNSDLSLVRLCLGFSCLGTFLLGLSWYKFSAIVSLIVSAGGAGFRDAYMSYITLGLQRHEIAKVYMMLSIVTLIAFNMGGSVIAGIYSACLRLGDSWETSLPIWVCSLPFALTALCLR